MARTGNERADAIAKAAVNDPSVTHSTITWAREKAKRRALKAWRRDWSSLPHTNQTAVALHHIPPSLRLNPSIREIEGPRDVQARVIHAITGHGHIGEYYARFVPTETPACPCGEPIQTRAHVLADCELHNASRHILHSACPNLSIALLLSTRKGLKALARFLKDSDVLRKARSDPPSQTAPDIGSREASPL
jgi:hypothetical protein